MDGVAALVAAGLVPGGSKRNLAYASPVTEFAAAIPETTRLLLADAQTSGGLLLCVAESAAAEMVARLRDAGAPLAARIGTLVDQAPGRAPIRVAP